MPSDLKDKNSEPIKEGDTVWTQIRGGKREGEVDKIVASEKQAQDEGVKNPPKASLRERIVHNYEGRERIADDYQVLFKDQHGHNVAHNPGTLEHKN